MTDDKKNDDDLQDDFSTSEFDEIYNDDDMELVDVDNIDVSDVEEVEDSDLDFVAEDIEEVYSEEPMSDEDDINLGDEAVMDEHQEPVTKKKKSSIGTLLIGLIVVGGAGAGAYFSGMIPGFGPQPSYQATIPADQPVNNGMSANEDIFADDQSQQQSQDTSQSEIEDLYAESFSGDENQQGVENVVASQETEEDNLGFLDSEDETETEVDELFAEPQDEQPVDPFVGNESVEEDLAIEEEAVEEELPLEEETIEEMPAPLMMSSSDTSQLANVEDEIANLKTQLNTLQGNLNSRLSDLESKLNNLPKATVSNNAEPVDLSGIESSLDKFADRLDGMEDQIASIKSSGAYIPAAAKKAEPKPSPAPAPTPAKTEAPAKVTYNWEIRAIQVGKAVIARKGETRNIVVGDSVPGLGTINDINYKNGGWVIEGSSGSVKQ